MRVSDSSAGGDADQVAKIEGENCALVDAEGGAEVPGVGLDAQDVVTRQVPNYEIYVGLLCRRLKPKSVRRDSASRAKNNLLALDRQKAEHLGPIGFFEERDLDKLSEKLTFTPQRGDNAQMVVLVGRNVPELRSAVRAAGEAKLLKGKQVALIMCGDSFGETESLRESLLSEGVLMVWTNDRQITYEAGVRLREHVRAIGETIEPTQRKTIDQLMNRALFRWYRQTPSDPDLSAFRRAASYVLIDSQPGRRTSTGCLFSPSFYFLRFSQVKTAGFLTPLNSYEGSDWRALLWADLHLGKGS
jgi:hypothetical protein